MIISSHTLNGNDGTHAAGVAVTLANLRTRETLFYTATDETGRLAEAVEPPGLPTDTYELTLQTGQVLESPRSVI
ncbi:MAG: hydroxyisourate hydrolase [Granulosicoccaceae bacterium]